jgi:hypothetical protein
MLCKRGVSGGEPSQSRRLLQTGCEAKPRWVLVHGMRVVRPIRTNEAAAMPLRRVHPGVSYLCCLLPSMVVCLLTGLAAFEHSAKRRDAPKCSIHAAVQASPMPSRRGACYRDGVLYMNLHDGQGNGLAVMRRAEASAASLRTVRCSRDRVTHLGHTKPQSPSAQTMDPELPPVASRVDPMCARTSTGRYELCRVDRNTSRAEVAALRDHFEARTARRAPRPQ